MDLQIAAAGTECLIDALGRHKSSETITFYTMQMSETITTLAMRSPTDRSQHQAEQPNLTHRTLHQSPMSDRSKILLNLMEGPLTESDNLVIPMSLNESKKDQTVLPLLLYLAEVMPQRCQAGSGELLNTRQHMREHQCYRELVSVSGGIQQSLCSEHRCLSPTQLHDVCREC